MDKDNDKLTATVKIDLPKDTKKLLNIFNKNIKQLSQQYFISEDLKRLIFNKVTDIAWYSTKPKVHDLCDEIIELLK